MNWLLHRIKGDRIIWLVVFALSMISVLSVYSSTGALAFREGRNASNYLLKHSIIVTTGLGVMYLAHLINHRYYSRISQILLYLSIPILIYTLFFGTRLNESSRWITLPIINQTFQSSDLAKLALFMYLGRELTKRQEKIKNFKQGFLPIFLAVIGICSLIAPANMSTAMIIFGTSMLLLLIGRVSFRQILLVGFAGLTIGLLVVQHGPRKGVYKQRIEVFIHPEDHLENNYQSDQAKIAIATGRIFGKGPGNSTQRNFLPSPYADFIYAIIIEEYGLFGGLIVLILYLVFLWRSVRIVTKSPKAFGALLAAALSISLVIQAFANMAVATNLIPVTGIALPLISMGGTSILFTSMAIGIILSVSRDIEEVEKKTYATTA